MRITTLWRATGRALRGWWDDNCLRLVAPKPHAVSGAVPQTKGGAAAERTPAL
jgi:hypothetical protein